MRGKGGGRSKGGVGGGEGYGWEVVKGKGGGRGKGEVGGGGGGMVGRGEG